MNKEKFFKFCFGCDPSVFTESVIVTPIFPLAYFKKYGEVLKEFKGRIYSGVVLAREGKNITVIYCGVGDRLMGDAVLLLGETPAQKIIFTGSCGGLKNCSIGDIILCENAFNGEGFSRYWSENFEINKMLNSDELIPANHEFTKDAKDFYSRAGDIFTIGSLAAEESENITRIEEKGFIGIDLELSAVYSAARKIGRKVTGLLIVSDLPFKKPLGEELTAGEKEAYKEGLEKVIGSSFNVAQI